MNGPWDYYTEWSWKEKSKYDIVMHICGIWKNWYTQSYLQSRNRDKDVENKCTDTQGGKEGWDELGDWDSYIYTIDTMYNIHN